MDEAQQLLLWRWSTLVQLSSVAMVAAFFALLARTNPRVELKWWARAWAFNLLAILATSLFWILRSDALLPIVSAVYVAGKSAFALMLMQGTWAMIRPGGRLFTTRRLTIGIAIYSVAVAAILRDVATVGIAQHSVIGVTLTGFAIALWRSRALGLTWLIAGFALRGVLALAEAAAYVIQLLRPATGPFAGWVELAGPFVSASSSFDTGSEWLLVLGSVLAVSERGRRQLENANSELVSAQENLPLRESFRPDDHVVRYGGDEFLVIAPGLDDAAARARVDELTRLMGPGMADCLSCGFSVGMSELGPGGSPEAALQIADQNMYKAKHRERT